ncbi:MAG: hypothetical protein WAX03_02180, partial [Trichococcus flocculiformis]
NWIVSERLLFLEWLIAACSWSRSLSRLITSMKMTFDPARLKGMVVTMISIAVSVQLWISA